MSDSIQSRVLAEYDFATLVDAALIELLVGLDGRPAHGDLAARLKVSVRSVQRSLARLREMGLVSWGRRGSCGNEYKVWLGAQDLIRREPQSEGVRPSAEPIREAIEQATGVPVPAADPLPSALARIGREHGAGVSDVAEWVAAKARRRQRIRSPGFFLAAARSDLPAWLAPRLEAARAAEVDRRRRDAELAEFRAGLRDGPPCHHCGGATDTRAEWSGTAWCRDCGLMNEERAA